MGKIFQTKIKLMEIKPIRIQRNRKSKQVSPNGLPVKYVGRPTKFGNPLKCSGDMIYIDASYRRQIFDKWVFLGIGGNITMIEIYKKLFDKQIVTDSEDIIYWNNKFKKLNLSELKGKNLSCWCKIGDFCHADYLLEIANK